MKTVSMLDAKQKLCYRHKLAKENTHFSADVLSGFADCGIRMILYERDVHVTCFLKERQVEPLIQVRQETLFESYRRRMSTGVSLLRK